MFSFPAVVVLACPCSVLSVNAAMFSLKYVLSCVTAQRRQCGIAAAEATISGIGDAVPLKVGQGVIVMYTPRGIPVR